MSDDQTLMDAMPAGREYVMPNDRKMYRGFEMPAGMSADQEQRYIDAIDEREDFAAKFGRELPRYSEFLRETVGGVKKSATELGEEAFKEVEGLRELGGIVGPAVKEVVEDIVLAKPRAKAYLYSEPEKAKEFGRAVLAGDRPAIKKLSEEASKSGMEPFATGAEAVLGGLAAEEGRYGEAALFAGGAMIPYFSPLFLQALKGGGKFAEKASERIKFLEEDFEAGRITKRDLAIEAKNIEQKFNADQLAEAMMDEPFMTIPKVGDTPEDLIRRQEPMSRREELAMVANRGGGRSVDERRDFRRSLYTKEGVDAADLKFRRALYTKKTFPEAMEVVERRFMTRSEPFKRVMASEIAGVEPSIEDLRALTSIEADEIKSRLVRTLRRTDQEAQQFMDRLESLKNTDKPPSGGKPPGGGGAARSATDANIFAGQRQGSYSGADRKMFDYLTDEPNQRIAEEMDFVEDRFERGDLTKDEALREYRIIAEAKQFDDYVDPDAYPNLSRPQTLIDRSMKGGGKPPGGRVASFKANEAAQQEYFRSKGLGVYAPEKSSPKFGLADQGHHNVVEDLGPLLPEDRALLEDLAGKYNFSETELRQLRDEYVAYGYDDFPGRSARGFEEIDIPDDLPGGGAADLDPEDLAMERRQDVYEGITTDMRGTPRVEPPSRDFTPDQMDELEAEARSRGLSSVDELLDLMEEGGSFRMKPVKQKFNLMDPRTGEYVRTKSGKIKNFNSPDEASEYAEEVLDDLTLGIRDLDGNIPPGWR